MKILVLGSESGDYFAHNVAYTLRKMGHDVLSDHMLGSDAGKSRLRRGVKLVLNQASHRWAMRDDRRAIALSKAHRPQLVLVCTRTYEPETIESIRRNGAMVICWFADSPANVQRGHITSNEYDAVFVKDSRFADDLRNVAGIEAFHLHEACNPDWHKPTHMEIKNHIAVAGTMYGYRNRIVGRLVDAGWSVRCYGPSPSPWVGMQVKKIHTGIFLDQTNKANAFGEALACLNTFSPAERNALNCRIFETCGCGGLLISEHKSAMDECFDPYEEYLPFSTFDELLEQLERANADGAMTTRIRANALRRAHSEHTYEHRLNKIFSLISLTR